MLDFRRFIRREIPVDVWQQKKSQKNKHTAYQTNDGDPQLAYQRSPEAHVILEPPACSRHPKPL
jgi:hypothetical protein